MHGLDSIVLEAWLATVPGDAGTLETSWNLEVLDILLQEVSDQTNLI